MSCAARLPIFILLVEAFFPEYKALALFGIYFFGIILAAIFAKIFKKFLFNRNETPFVMELPTYRVPTVKYILNETWDKGSQYLKKIGTTILVGSVIVWALGYFPIAKTDKTVKDTENSYLAKIGKTIEPALKPLGYDWKISVALLSGAAAKEVVVSTLGVLYNKKEDNPTPFWVDFCQSLKEAFSDNKIDLEAELKSAKRADNITPVYSLATVISLMLFVLIYFPCIATIAAVKHETGKWRWAVFVALYTLVLAWLIAFAAYNIINLQLYQEMIVALVVLLCLIVSIRKFLHIKKAKNKCGACFGC
jgi:ferrous iron transport protein B